LLGRSFKLTEHRGEWAEWEYEPLITATVHPSSILRAPDDRARHEQTEAFVRDLKKVGQTIARRRSA
jgi:DNA polymerase